MSDIVFDFVKFLREDVKTDKLQESTDKAYSGVAKENADMLKENDIMLQSPAFTSRMLPKDKKDEKKTTDEGKLPADPSEIKAPESEIQMLAEEKDEKKEKEVKAEEMPQTAKISTEEPEKGKLQKEMDKATPNVDKKSDFKVAAGVDKVKDEKKSEVTVAGVVSGTTKESKVNEEQKAEDPINVSTMSKAELVEFLEGNREIITNPDDYSTNELRQIAKKYIQEGKLPTDPSEVKNPEAEIQMLAEEKVLTSLSDEQVAKDIASKYPGGRVVSDPQSKQFIVMVQEKKLKEEKTSEPTAAEIKATEVPGVKDEKDSKITNVPKTDPKESSIKSAEADVSKSPDDKVVGDKGASTGKQDAPTDQKIDPGTKTVTNQDAPKVSDSTKTTEQEKPAVAATKPTAKVDAKEEDKLTPESKIKEDTDVTVKTDDKEVNIVSTESGTQVTSLDVGEQPLDRTITGVPESPVTDEIVPPVEVEEEGNETDGEAEEMAERIFVAEHLGTLEETKLTSKQKEFISEAKKIKKTKKVNAKLQALKKEKK